MNNLQPIDIAERLSRCFPYWNEMPTYRIFGKVHDWGMVRIETSEWSVSWRMYIQDLDWIRWCICVTLQNFPDLVRLYWED